MFRFSFITVFLVLFMAIAVIASPTPAPVAEAAAIQTPDPPWPAGYREEAQAAGSARVRSSEGEAISCPATNESGGGNTEVDG